KSDTTAPVITGTVLTAQQYGGVYGGPITVHWSCADAGSRVAHCPDDTTVTGIGTDSVAVATATDKAGNTALGTVAGLFTRDEATYAYGTSIHPSCQATDADGRAVTCAGLVSGGRSDGSGLFSYRATAADPITGKVSAARVSWTVGSKPAPHVTVTGRPSKT